jgi:hypothetical protein
VPHLERQSLRRGVRDGDPLDVLVLMDEPAFPGCKLTCRVIGVIEGEHCSPLHQTGAQGGALTGPMSVRYRSWLSLLPRRL